MVVGKQRPNNDNKSLLLMICNFLIFDNCETQRTFLKLFFFLSSHSSPYSWARTSRHCSLSCCCNHVERHQSLKSLNIYWTTFSRWSLLCIHSKFNYNEISNWHHTDRKLFIALEIHFFLCFFHFLGLIDLFLKSHEVSAHDWISALQSYERMKN